MKNKELHKITQEEYEDLNWEANTFHCQKHNTFWYAGGNQAVYCKECEELKKLYKLRSVVGTKMKNKDINEKIDELFENFNQRIDKSIEKFEGRLTQIYNNIFESNTNEKKFYFSAPTPLWKKGEKIEMKKENNFYVVKEWELCWISVLFIPVMVIPIRRKYILPSLETLNPTEPEEK